MCWRHWLVTSLSNGCAPTVRRQFRHSCKRHVLALFLETLPRNTFSCLPWRVFVCVCALRMCVCLPTSSNSPFFFLSTSSRRWVSWPALCMRCFYLYVGGKKQTMERRHTRCGARRRQMTFFCVCPVMRTLRIPTYPPPSPPRPTDTKAEKNCARARSRGSEVARCVVADVTITSASSLGNRKWTQAQMWRQ